MKRCIAWGICMILGLSLICNQSIVMANDVNDSNFIIKYYEDENTNPSENQTEVEFGTPTKTLTTEEAGISKEGMVAIGWYAYREYDQCWCYDVNGTMGWYKEKPEGGVLHLYGNGCKVAETAPAGTVVHFYAQWIKDEFTVKYFSDEGMSQSNQVTIVQRGKPTAIKTLEELGFTNGNKKFAGWKIKRESDGCCRVTDGTNVKWADKLEDGWKYDLYARDAIISKTASAGETLDFYATWSDIGAAFEIAYYKDEESDAEERTSQIEYGVPTQTLTVEDLEIKKEGMVATGWHAYREVDQSWCYDVNGSIEWHKERPKDGTLHLYGNGCRVAATAPAGTKVHFYAQWIEDKFKIKYFQTEDDTDCSNQITTVQRGVPTAIKTIQELGFVKGTQKFVGWKIKRESDGYWKVTNGTTVKWAKNIEDGWKYEILPYDAIVSKTAGAGEALDFYATWSDTGAIFEINYHKDETSPAEEKVSNIEYGVSTKILTAKELNLTEEEKIVKGWVAYREYDQSWCYDVDGKLEWCKEKPEKGTLHVYSDGCSVAKTAPAGTKVHFYAQWVENSYTIQYHDEMNSEPSEHTTKVNIGESTQILGATDLGFHKKGKVLLGWRAYQSKYKKWCVTDGHEIKWASSPESGWDYYLYKNTCSVKETVAPGETVDFYAIWISSDIDIDQEIFKKNSESDFERIQLALNCAKKSSEPVTINIPSGKYYINDTLQIFSNTTLKLDEKAEIIRTDDSKCMLVTGSATGKFEGEYNQFVNVKIEGGIWNGNVSKINKEGYGSEKSDLMYFWHGSNFELSNTILESCCGYHHIEIAGMKSVKIDKVVCKDFVKCIGDIYQKSDIKTSDDVINLVEAIQIDYAGEDNSSGAYPFDGTACQDIIVSNCMFENCRSGVGNHHGDKASTDLEFINNSFNNMSYSCYNIQNMSNVKISKDKAINVVSFLWEIDNSSVAMKDNDIKYGKVINSDTINMIDVKNSYLYMEKNSILGTGGDGIKIDTNSKVDIINNEFKEMNGCVLRINNADINVDGNLFSKCTDYSVYIYDNAEQKSNGKVINNTFCGLGEVIPDYIYTDNNSCDEKNVYKIIFDGNGGTGTMQNQTITYGVSTQLNKNQYKNGEYMFKGWNAYRESDGKWYTTEGWRSEKEINEKDYEKFVYPDQTTVSKSSPVNGDKVIMYAQWKLVKYTVTYDGNGGTGSMKEQTVTYGVPTQLNKNQYQKSGYRLKGWNAYRESDKKWYTTEGWRSEKEIHEKGYEKFVYPDQTTVSKSSPINGDKVTMYAKWILVTKK